jgi:hypothetical protein
VDQQKQDDGLDFQAVFDEITRSAADRIGGLLQELALTRVQLAAVTKQRDDLAQRLAEQPPRIADGTRVTRAVQEPAEDAPRPRDT